MNKLVLLLMFFCAFSVCGQSGLDSLRLVLPVGHTGTISIGEISKDDNYILTSSVDNTAKIWHLKSGDLIHNLIGHKESILYSVFNSEGNLILTSSSDKTARLWDFKSGKMIRVFDAHDAPVVKSIFSSNKDYVFTAGNSEVKMWNVNNGNLIRVFEGHKSIVNNIELSNDGKLLLTSSMDGTSMLFSTETGKLVNRFGDENHFVIDAIFSKDDENLVTTSINSVKIWDVKTGVIKNKLEEPDSNIKFTSVSKNGKFVITGSSKNVVSVWDLETGSKKNIIQPTKYLQNAIFSNDCNEVIIASDNEINIYDISSLELRKTMKGHRDKINDVVLNESGTYILTISKDKTAIVWDLKKGSIVSIFKGYSLLIDIVKESNDGKSLFTVTNDNVIRNWCHKSSMIKNYFRGHTSSVNSVSIDFNGQKLASTSWDKSVKLWDIEENRLIHTLNDHSSWVKYAGFCEHGKYIISTSADKSAKIWDAESGQLLKTLIGHTLLIYSADFSSNAKYIVTGSGDKTARIWDAESGICLKILKGHTSYISKPFFLDGDNFVLTVGDNRIIIWDVNSGEILTTISENSDFIRSIIISEDEKYIISHSIDNSISVWKSENLKTSFKKIWDLQFVSSVSLFDKNNLLLVSANNSLDFIDLKTGDVVIHVDGNFKSGFFSLKDSIVIAISNDHKVVFYNYVSAKNLFDRIILENNNYLIQLPNSPYYMCSKDASKMLHYITPSLKVIGFEQLDPVYNRPDIVLDSIGRYFGNNDRGMIEEYRKAWEKRIERLGLKDQMDKLGKGEISVPNAEIENAETIAYENSEGTVNIVVKANDPKYKLRRFNVWVNEVPLYGSSGISIAGFSKNEWDTTLSVPLSLGDNKIQVSVMNELGLENFKYPLYVKYNSDMVVPKTHYIGIGVDKFDNGKNLSFCVKDIKDLGKYFSKLPNSSIKLLTEKEVNKENITKLKEYLKTTSVHDRVIISCSSHGILDSTRNFYLATHDTDFESPGKNGISFELLDGLLDEIPARKKLLLLDACNSGENDEGFAKIDNSSSGGRGTNVKIGDEIVKESNFKKMKELFVNVRNNSGAYIISATGGIQKALEGEAVMLDGKPIENGSFTYAVLEYLREHDGIKEMLTVKKLKKYVEQRVIELTNGKQTPTSRQETMEIDWDLK